MIMKCQYCSYQHQRDKCPAFQKFCNGSHKRGHFAKCCRNKTRTANVANAKEYTDSSSTESDSETLYIGTITNDNYEKPLESDHKVMEIKIDTVSDNWIVHLETNGTDIKYKIDTGADIIPYYDYLRLQKVPRLLPSQIKLSAYNGSSIPVKGKCILYINNKG